MSNSNDFIDKYCGQARGQRVKAPFRGEVWMLDLGLAAKVRRCLVLSLPIGESDRSLVTLIAHTATVRQF